MPFVRNPLARMGCSPGRVRRKGRSLPLQGKAQDATLQRHVLDMTAMRQTGATPLAMEDGVSGDEGPASAG